MSNNYYGNASSSGPSSGSGSAGGRASHQDYYSSSQVQSQPVFVSDRTLPQQLPQQLWGAATQQPYYNDASTSQQPQQAQQQSFWNPATAATMAAMAASNGFSGDAVLDLASSAGKTFLQNSTARMVPGLESSMLMLRSYFAVDNRYVLCKMKKILVPFLAKQWKRTEKEPSGLNIAAVYDLPSVDENAPDLYLPVMSLITYVLLCALCYGTAGQFNPEVIQDVTTKCFVTQILEVLVIRFGFYMMQAQVALLDLFSYTGYKYLGLCINMMVGLLLGHFGFGARGFYVTFLWTASAASFFMLKTMANNIPAVTAAAGPKREFMVLAFAASQFATMYFVSQTKFL